jgi:hypothetical protein
MGVKDDEWQELPGPAEWWPEDPENYLIKHGFIPRPDQTDNYREAGLALLKEKPPPGWMDALVHENSHYDLVWNSHFRR